MKNVSHAIQHPLLRHNSVDDLSHIFEISDALDNMFLRLDTFYDMIWDHADEFFGGEYYAISA
jgi:hypothetical protein